VGSIGAGGSRLRAAQPVRDEKRDEKKIQLRPNIFWQVLFHLNFGEKEAVFGDGRKSIPTFCLTMLRPQCQLGYRVGETWRVRSSRH